MSKLNKLYLNETSPLDKAFSENAKRKNDKLDFISFLLKVKNSVASSYTHYTLCHCSFASGNAELYL